MKTKTKIVRSIRSKFRTFSGRTLCLPLGERDVKDLQRVEVWIDHAIANKRRMHRQISQYERRYGAFSIQMVPMLSTNQQALYKRILFYGDRSRNYLRKAQEIINESKKKKNPAGKLQQAEAPQRVVRG